MQAGEAAVANGILATCATRSGYFEFSFSGSFTTSLKSTPESGARDQLLAQLARDMRNGIANLAVGQQQYQAFADHAADDDQQHRAYSWLDADPLHGLYHCPPGV